MDHEDATDLATRVEDALKANESRKLALMEYIHNLEAHLASVDALIGSAEAHMDVPDDMESDEELPYVVSVPNAIPAVPPISASQLEDMSSPFYHACQRHRLYNDLTSARNWTETENAALKDAVQREGMRYHALQLQSQGYNALLSLENVPLESYGELKEHLDWDRIARYIPNRLPSMCKVQWLSNLHPGVRRGPWSEEERIDLLRAVREARISARNATRMDIDAIQTGESLVSNEDDARIDWEVVAGYMANGRIPIDCMKAYRAASERRIPTVWDSELDEALLQAVEKYGASNMTTVAMSMPISITRQQCMSRYEVLVDKRVSGKWSEEEDTRLKALLQEIPPETEGRWKIISERMKTRSERQCRARFRDVLDNSYKRDDWSESEDRIIQEALVTASASNRKPDIKGLAKQLNRPIEKLRKRVIAFSSGHAPKKAFQRGNNETKQSKGTTQSTKVRNRTSSAPDTPYSSASLPKESQMETQGQYQELDQDGENAGLVEQRHHPSDDDSDSDYQEELSVREARKRRTTRQRETQTVNLRRIHKERNTRSKQ